MSTSLGPLGASMILHASGFVIIFLDSAQFRTDLATFTSWVPEHHQHFLPLTGSIQSASNMYLRDNVAVAPKPILLGDGGPLCPQSRPPGLQTPKTMQAYGGHSPQNTVPKVLNPDVLAA